MTEMKAVRIHDFGGLDSLVIDAIPVPEPREGEVQVAVHAASVNPVDWQLTYGINQDFMNRVLPTILGFDVAGVVTAVGSGVADLAVGDRVYGHTDFRLDGAFAEYICCARGRLVPMPGNLSFSDAAAVPVAALAAWTGFFGAEAVNLQSDQTVLITAAAGGVGTFAVQFAKWAGARVVATASADNHAFLTELGADQVIDYKTGNLADALPELDAVLDAVGGDTQIQALQRIRTGGVLASLVGEQWGDSNSAPQVRKFVVHGGYYPQALAEITPLLESGSVKPVVSGLYPLEKARDALALNKTGHVRGKLVIQVR